MRSTLLLLALAGCPDRTIGSVYPVQGKVTTKDIPANPRRTADILFLIDDSGSMKEEQDSLRANFSRFMGVLETLEGGMPDVHIGVATSDLGTSATDGTTAGAAFGCANHGDGGAMRTAPMITGRFIADDGKGTVNYSGTLDAAFSAIADVGTAGCGIEQHLGAVERALSNPTNAGFVRPDAYLAVVVIGDEDDCSLAHPGLFTTSNVGEVVNFACTKDGVECDDTPGDMTTPGDRTSCHPSDHAKYVESVDRYVQFLEGLKPDRRDVVVAGIVGDPSPFTIATDNGTSVLGPSCSYAGPSGTQHAFPAVRTADFLSQFPLSSRSTICGADLSGAMTQIGALLKSAFGDPCFETQLADADPSTPAPDYDCTVTDVRRVASGADQELAVIPPCGTNPTIPCWRIEEDAVQCAYTQTNPHLKLVVDRGGVVPPSDVHVVASCVTTDPAGGGQF
jgi:hypothetical protein